MRWLSRSVWRRNFAGTLVLLGALITALGCEEPLDEAEVDYKDLLLYPERLTDTRVTVTDDLGIYRLVAEKSTFVYLTEYFACFESPYTGNDPDVEDTFLDYCYAQRDLTVIIDPSDIADSLYEGRRVELRGTVHPLIELWEGASRCQYGLDDIELTSDGETVATGGAAIVESPLCQ